MLTDILVKIFVRDSGNTKDAAVRARYGALAGATGILTNVIVATAKLIIGFAAGSVSVMADASNNLSDAGSSLVTLVGFRLSGRPADREHPYGHAQYEYITGLIVSFIVVLLGGFFLYDSIMTIVNGDTSDFGVAAIIVLVISIAVKLWQSLFYRKLSVRIHSESLKASSTDSRNDVITTAAVLVGAIVNKTTGLEIDGYVGVAVALFILVSGVKLVISTANPLIGTAPAKETVRALNDKILSYEGVYGTHDMIMHSYGANQIFCSIHVEVPSDQDIMVSHDIVDCIEEDIYNEMGIHLVIHMDPVAVGNEVVDTMRADVAAVVSGISADLTFHDFRVVFGVTHNNLLFDLVVPVKFAIPDDELIAIITHEIKAKYPSSNVKIKLDRDYSDFLTSDK